MRIHRLTSFVRARRALATFTLLGLCSGTLVAADAPLRVLLLSGQNNHDWATTTPKLESILEATGRFTVEVTERPDQLTSEKLAPFDVILGNWNSWGSGPDTAPLKDWPAATREAYLDFLRRGKGQVIVHAGASSFYDWPEYQQAGLAAWGMGETQHGPPHEFPVRMDTWEHPVVTGLRSFHTKDELWINPAVQPGAQVLASGYASAGQPQGSGKWEPVALAGRLGEGRCFTLLLGHDATFMENAGFRALLTRGTEWAGTGRVTIKPPAEVDAGAVPFTWEQTDSSVALMRGDQVVWRFNHGPGEAKPSFHPVALPDGPNLTWYRPADHRWHRALWFSWKYIDGVNYWEEDARTGASAGRTEQKPPAIHLTDDHSARITQELAYRPAGGEPVLQERRVIEVSMPVAEMRGQYFMDWDLTFTALQDLVLDRTPLPNEPGGEVFGGYAGLSVRFIQELAEREALTTEEQATWTQDRYRGKASGLDYTGRIDGQEMGIAILDHPDNLNAPSPWYAINGAVMHYFSPAVICYGPHQMKTGETLRLRYRVIVHPGRFSQAQLRAAVADYAGRE